MENSLPLFSDIGDKSEDDRIAAIGRALMAGHVVAFITDDEPDKWERYVRKLKNRYPGTIVTDQFRGPTRGCVTVKVRLGNG